MKDTLAGVRIGCFGGFWGDSTTLSVGQFLSSPEGESLDYLVADYLAEVTMCILAKKSASGSKQPANASPQADASAEGAYIDEFATTIWRTFGAAITAKGIKVVVNAGGLNPLGLKAAIEKESTRFDPLLAKRVVVAAVTGDNLKSKAAALFAEKRFESFAVDGVPADFDVSPDDGPGATNPFSSSKHLTSNAYLGAGPIAAALAGGATVVVTGRVVDSALILGPLIYEHRWRMTDYDLLAAGTMAGHLIECGAQCTGGNFTDWELGLKAAAGQDAGAGGGGPVAARRRGSASSGQLFENMGFPIATVAADGATTISKPTGTAGIVSRLSVAEQLVYEIGDPTQYHVADVICDFSRIQMQEIYAASAPANKERGGAGAPIAVRVTGAKGRPPSGRYKVTSTFASGYTASFAFALVGPAAALKAKAIATTLVNRATKVLQRMSGDPEERYREVRVEYIGGGSFYRLAPDPLVREVVCRISVRHPNPRAVLLVGANIASASTGMCPGLFALSSGRATPSAAIALRSHLILADTVPALVAIGPQQVAAQVPREWQPQPAAPQQPPRSKGTPPAAFASPAAALSGATTTAALMTLACCRSGDKGDAANVGVVARRPQYFEFLKAHLTSESVHEYLRPYWFDVPDGIDSPFEHTKKLQQRVAAAGGNSAGKRVQRYELPQLPALNFVLSHVLGGGGIDSLKADKQGKSIGSILLDMSLPNVPVEWVDDYRRTIGATKQRILAKL